jgi:Zn-dependent protease with chaperone function
LNLAILLGDFGLGAAMTIILNWLALIPFRRSKGKHWTERARRLHPARVNAGWNVWLVPAIIVLGQRLLIPEEDFWWLPVAFASWLGALAGGYVFTREVFPSMTPREWIHETLVVWGLSIGWWALFISIATLMPAELGWRNWLLAGIYLGAVVGWAFGGLIWCLKTCRRLKPAPEKLRRIVERVSTQMKVLVRGVWLLQSKSATAFALPYTRDLFFSETLLATLPEEEIAAICAHELGHFCEPRPVLILRLSGCLAALPFLFIKPIFHQWGPGGVFFAAAAYWMCNVLLQKLAHAMEVRADRIARSNQGEPGVYARALARLYENNIVPAVLEQKHTHPHLYDRLVNAGVAPDYPRPEPADDRSFLRYLLWLLIFFLIAENFFDLW